MTDRLPSSQLLHWKNEYTNQIQSFPNKDAEEVKRTQEGKIKVRERSRQQKRNKYRTKLKVTSGITKTRTISQTGAQSGVTISTSARSTESNSARFGSDNRGIKLNVYVVALGNWHHCASSPNGERRGAR